jgi:hypothetical protein
VKSLATGNGRRTTAGVDGTSFISGEDDAELDEDKKVELGAWDVAASGTGVGGKSASIISTCQDLLSSKNFSRSAYIIIH